MRSNPANDEAIEYIRSGALGKILLARGFTYKYRPGIGKTAGKGHIPETLDYDLWCGPAKKGPIDRAQLHYDWHWVWDTGGGEIANNGPHQLDMIRWALGEKGLPRRVMGLGGRFGYDDAGETPNTMLALYDYASAPVIFEVRGLGEKPGARTMDTFRAAGRKGRVVNRWNGGTANTDVLIECEGGYVDFNAEGAFDYSGKQIRKFDNAERRDPQSSFIHAVRTRKTGDIKTDIEEGHVSTNLCHLGNISYRLGAAARPESIREAMRGDRDALEAFGRFAEHFAVHGIDLSRTPAVLGPWLNVDSKAERLTGAHSAAANVLVRREYRAPYLIPDKV